MAKHICNILIGLVVLLAGCGNDNSVKSNESVSSEDWVRGYRDTPISVVTYMDLECPFSKEFYATLQSLLREYPGTINLVFRHYPLTALYSKSAKEAEASECAGYLGGNDVFWKYVDRIYEITPSGNRLDLAELRKIAEYVGLDSRKFMECFDSGQFKQKIANSITQAEAAGAQGTPYTVILSAGNQQRTIAGAVSYDELWTIFDSFLKDKGWP